MNLKAKILFALAVALLFSSLTAWVFGQWAKAPDRHHLMLLGAILVFLGGAAVLWKLALIFTRPFVESKAAFESIFDAANLGIVLSNEDGIIQQVNPFTNQLFGYRGDELLGQKIEVLIPPELRGKHVGHRAEFNQSPKSRAMGFGMDLSALKKDGTLLPVEVSLTFFERQGKREIVSFISDITTRKKIEGELKVLNAELEKKVRDRTGELSQAFLELQQTNRNLEREMEQRRRAEAEAQAALEKAKEVNEMKSRFVSIASHEFRTPLSSILTSAALISRYDEAADSEKRAKHIQIIKGSVHALTGILNDFLSLDKLEKGRIEQHPSEFSLRAFAQELADEMKDIARTGQRIVYAHAGEDRKVFLDRQLLRSILVNLLSNAIKYSPEGTEIRLLTECSDSQVTITLRDQGIGIPDADQKHLFDSFFRAKNVSAVQGTGLGLHIVKRCLDLMGGIIEFSSKENEGSTFKVIFSEVEGAKP